MKKKAQVWTVDYLMGFLIFIIVLVFSIKIIFSIVPSQDFQFLYNDGIHISTSLVESGSPNDWNVSTVIVPGIADNNRINFTKLSSFDNLSYQQTKTLFHTPNDYLFFFKNSTGLLNFTKCIRGYNATVDNSCNPLLTLIEYSSLVKFERIVILNSSLATMVVYVWN